MFYIVLLRNLGPQAPPDTMFAQFIVFIFIFIYWPTWVSGYVQVLVLRRLCEPELPPVPSFGWALLGGLLGGVSRRSCEVERVCALPVSVK